MLLCCNRGQSKESEWCGQREEQSPRGSKTGVKMGNKTNILNPRGGKKFLRSARVKLLSQIKGKSINAIL